MFIEWLGEIWESPRTRFGLCIGASMVLLALLVAGWWGMRDRLEQPDTEDAWVVREVHRLRELSPAELRHQPSVRVAVSGQGVLVHSSHPPIKQGILRFANGEWLFVEAHAAHGGPAQAPRGIWRLPGLKDVYSWWHEDSVDDVTLAVDAVGSTYVTYRNVDNGISLNAGREIRGLDDYLAWTPPSAAMAPMDGAWLHVDVTGGAMTIRTPMGKPDVRPTLSKTDGMDRLDDTFETTPHTTGK